MPFLLTCESAKPFQTRHHMWLIYWKFNFVLAVILIDFGSMLHIVLLRHMFFVTSGAFWCTKLFIYRSLFSCFELALLASCLIIFHFLWPHTVLKQCFVCNLWDFLTLCWQLVSQLVRPDSCACLMAIYPPIAWLHAILCSWLPISLAHWKSGLMSLNRTYYPLCNLLHILPSYACTGQLTPLKISHRSLPKCLFS